MKNWTKSRIRGVLASLFLPRWVRNGGAEVSSSVNSRSLRNSPAAWATARCEENTNS